jgi:hypothetical protein
VLLTRLDATGNIGTVSASRSGTDGATLVGGSRESRRAVVLTVRGGGGVFVARDGGKAELSGDSLSRSVFKLGDEEAKSSFGERERGVVGVLGDGGGTDGQ